MDGLTSYEDKCEHSNIKLLFLNTLNNVTAY